MIGARTTTTSPSDAEEVIDLVENAGTIADLRVILVDDDTFVVSALSRLVETLGVEDIRTATTGDTVLRQLERRPADVVVLDVNMPGMDGVELLRHLAAVQPSPAVILVSAEDPRILQTAHQLGQAHQLDVLGALAKPVRPDRLEEYLLRLLQGGDRSGRPRQDAAKAFELTPEEIRRGLDGQRLVPYYQPKVAAKGGRVVGVEALARWRHDDRGIVPPSAFIPVAERSGLIKDLTRSMVELALADAGRWRREGCELVTAVNVSVLDVEDLDFVGFMTAAATARGLDPSDVLLEVTESRIVDRVTTALETLARLRLRGFRLAVDDYGTGASTLDQVRRLPVEEVKIDRSFVTGCSDDHAMRAMIESTVGLAQQLDLSTVAEGVETDSDARTVRGIGVDVIQGFGVAKPMPANDFRDWLSAQG